MQCGLVKVVMYIVRRVAGSTVGHSKEKKVLMIARRAVVERGSLPLVVMDVCYFQGLHVDFVALVRARIE